MYFQKSDVKGKTALVTGAGKGIGKASAIALAEAGADLIILSQDLNVFEISLNSNYNSPIDLTVFDLLGHQIISKKLQNKGSGYNFTLDMSYAAKGVYLVRLGNSAYSKVRKIVTQ